MFVDKDDKELEQQSQQSKNPPMREDDFGPDHVWQDDGTTSFADMDLTRPLHQQKHSKKVEFDLSKKEIRAIRRAMFLRYLPPIICGICGFTIAMLIITLWLS